MSFARLREAMAPDPSRWTFTGIVKDTGRRDGSTCACGQAIRYEFVIRCIDDGRALNIGSECIKTSVPGLIAHGAHKLVDDLDAARRRHDRMLNAARADAKAAESIWQLRRDIKRLRNWQFERRKEFLERGGSKWDLPPVLYRVGDFPNGDGVAKEATAIRRYFVATWRKAYLVCEDDRSIRPYPPEPRDARLLAQLDAAFERAMGEPRPRPGRASVGRSLPDADEAEIAPSKLIAYALNQTHGLGVHKARVFRAALGIEADDWRYLHDAILKAVEDAPVEKIQETRYGQQCTVPVKVDGLNGERRTVVTAWEVTGDRPPRLTTLYVR